MFDDHLIKRLWAMIKSLPSVLREGFEVMREFERFGKIWKK